jgi:hypothetical protein
MRLAVALLLFGSLTAHAANNRGCTYVAPSDKVWTAGSAQRSQTDYTWKCDLPAGADPGGVHDPDSSRSGNIVLDLFGGSGTTLIAEVLVTEVLVTDGSRSLQNVVAA